MRNSFFGKQIYQYINKNICIFLNISLNISEILVCFFRRTWLETRDSSSPYLSKERLCRQLLCLPQWSKWMKWAQEAYFQKFSWKICQSSWFQLFANSILSQLSFNLKPMRLSFTIFWYFCRNWSKFKQKITKIVNKTTEVSLTFTNLKNSVTCR